MTHTFYRIALALTVIGGFNWGLVGLFRFNLVAALLGIDTIITRLVYSLVGLSALYVAFSYGRPSRP